MDISLILAAMVSLIQPGHSIYSQTVVADDAAPACDNKASLLCAAPHLNPAWGAFTRPETHAEGLARYGSIAKVIAAVVGRSRWQGAEGCPRPRVVRWVSKVTGRCAELRRARPWTGTESELARMLVTVAYHESGFRRDIQAGKGAASRGDCKKGKRCRSICIGQIMKTRRNWTSPRGYKHEALAGLDEASTTRCVETMVDYLSHARNYCVSPYGPVATGATCILGTYGGVAAPARDPRILGRVKTYRRTTALMRGN